MTVPHALPRRVGLFQLPRRDQERGSLWVAELGEALPFTSERFFFIDRVPEGTRRGDHANTSTHQFLVALRGRVRVVLGPEPDAPVIDLDDPGVGLHIPPLVWASQVYGADALLLVAASTPFHDEGHIDDPADPRLRWD